MVKADGKWHLVGEGDFDGVIDILNASGWLVTDCYQPRVGMWTVALRKEGDFTRAYGNGETATEALQKAMDNRHAKPVDERKDKRPLIGAPDYYETGTRGRLQRKPATGAKRVRIMRSDDD